MQYVFLCRPKNEIDRYLYEELLRKHSVPYSVEKRIRPCGEIHVAPEDLERAKEITRIISEEEQASAQARLDKDRNQKRLGYVIVMLFVVVPVIYLLVKLVI
ncbi:MAG: hypothetical protein R6W96_04750 [Clostridia bacterium]